MIAYGIIRAEKVKFSKIQPGLQKHLQRESKTGFYASNPDINKSLADDNVVLIRSDNFKKSVEEEIQKHNVTRKIRPDAVGLLDGMTTVSGEFFKDMSKADIVDYFKDMLPLIEKQFGPVISAVIHGDEKEFNSNNWHMHFATVPIIQNDNGTYSLSAKRVMGNKSDLVKKQDFFHKEYFSKYGLLQGVSAKETGAKHIATSRWKAEQIKKQAEISTATITDNEFLISEQDIKIKEQEKYLQDLNKTVQDKQQELVEITLRNKSMIEEEKALNEQIAILQDDIKSKQQVLNSILKELANI